MLAWPQGLVNVSPPSEYFSELMSQAYLAKVNLINIINPEALGVPYQLCDLDT